MGNVLKQIVFVSSVLDVHCTISTPSLSLTVVFIFIRLRVPPYINHVLNLIFYRITQKEWDFNDDIRCLNLCWKTRQEKSFKSAGNKNKKIRILVSESKIWIHCWTADRTLMLSWNCSLNTHPSSGPDHIGSVNPNNRQYSQVQNM